VRGQRSALLSLLAIAATDRVLVRVRNRARSRPTGVGVARCVESVTVQSCAKSVPGVGLFLNGRRKRAVRRAEILSMISKPTRAEHTAEQYPDQVDHEQHARLLHHFESIRNDLWALSSPARGREIRTVGSSPASRLGRRHPGGDRLRHDAQPKLVGGRARAAEGAGRAQKVLGGARSLRS
jgi:hypothetical protein